MSAAAASVSCTHGRASFVEVEALGERWKACPVCCPAYR